MNTRRRKDPDSPMSHSAYMSSPEFTELRGINAVYVKEKTSITLSPIKRHLLWYLQARSLEEGGIKAIAKSIWDSTYAGRGTWHDQARLEGLLVDLCVNPRTLFSVPGEDEVVKDFERESARSRFPELVENDFSEPRYFFKDLGAALLEHKQRFEAEVESAFCATAITRKIWRSLDFALRTRSMVLIDGLEGRGKTEALKAWCRLHLGEARYVSLNGINSKTAAFREIAKALGVASSYTRKASEMQSRVEDVLERSKLLLVIDEAHWLFNQSARIYTRPELVDWIVTALCNHGVPVALCTTPQFLQCMSRAIQQVGWNHRQFQRRCARRIVLPKNNTHGDIETVADAVFPKIDKEARQALLGYIRLSKRDLSALGDVVREVRYGVNPLAPDKVDLKSFRLTYERLEEIIERELVPGDAAFAFDLAHALKKGESRLPREFESAPSKGSQPVDSEPVEEAAIEARGRGRGLEMAVK